MLRCTSKLLFGPKQIKQAGRRRFMHSFWTKKKSILFLFIKRMLITAYQCETNVSKIPLKMDFVFRKFVQSKAHRYAWLTAVFSFWSMPECVRYSKIDHTHNKITIGRRLRGGKAITLMISIFGGYSLVRSAFEIVRESFFVCVPLFYVIFSIFDIICRMT